MSYYKTCPHCGANLDAGERCYCEHEKTPAGAGTDVNSNKKNNVSVSSIAQNENMYKQFLKEWDKYFMGALK